MWYLREKDEIVCRAVRFQEVLELYRPEHRTIVTAIRLNCDHEIIEQRAYYSEESGRWTVIDGKRCIYDFPPVRNANRTLLAAANDCRDERH